MATRNTTSLIGFHRPCLTAEERKGPRLTAPVFNVRSADKLCRFWTRRSGSAIREPEALARQSAQPVSIDELSIVSLESEIPAGG